MNFKIKSSIMQLCARARFQTRADEFSVSRRLQIKPKHFLAKSYMEQKALKGRYNTAWGIAPRKNHFYI
jgi:hypothetical protein